MPRRILFVCQDYFETGASFVVCLGGLSVSLFHHRVELGKHVGFCLEMIDVEYGRLLCPVILFNRR